MYKMKMLSQLGTDQLSDLLFELLEWLFATKNALSAELFCYSSREISVDRTVISLEECRKSRELKTVRNIEFQK